MSFRRFDASYPGAHHVRATPAERHAMRPANTKTMRFGIAYGTAGRAERCMRRLMRSCVNGYAPTAVQPRQRATAGVQKANQGVARIRVGPSKKQCFVLQRLQAECSLLQAYREHGVTPTRTAFHAAMQLKAAGAISIYSPALPHRPEKRLHTYTSRYPGVRHWS